MTEEAINKRYPQMDKLEDNPVFSKQLATINTLKEKYNKAVDVRDKLVKNFRRLAFNQIDRQIIDFCNSVGAYGLTDGEWKLIIKEGIENSIDKVEKSIYEIAEQLNTLIKN